MGSVIPELKLEIESARHDLDALAETRKSIARERDSLTEKIRALAGEKLRLAALIDARQQSLASAQEALGSQQQRATELGRRATSLKDLIGRLDGEKAARQAADVAAATEIEARARAAPGVDMARMKPEIAFAESKGRVPLPAVGEILKTFGSTDDVGGIEHGVSLATPAGATVSAPADGAVLFAGAYRSYGQLLILDAGGGYYVLLAGMERINVQSGEFVLAGEPVGAMGDGSVRTAMAAAVGVARPVLYIELRKDGTAIDPGPWWVKADIEKARG
jgi:murein hydrolase activator